MATSKEIKLKAIVDVDMGDITQVQTELQKVQQLLTVNRNQQTSLTAEILSRQKSLERPTISNETKKIVEEQIKQYEQQRKALENELKKLEDLRIQYIGAQKQLSPYISKNNDIKIEKQVNKTRKKRTSQSYYDEMKQVQDEAKKYKEEKRSLEIKINRKPNKNDIQKNLKSQGIYDDKKIENFFKIAMDNYEKNVIKYQQRLTELNQLIEKANKKYQKLKTKLNERITNKGVKTYNEPIGPKKPPKIIQTAESDSTGIGGASTKDKEKEREYSTPLSRMKKVDIAKQTNNALANLVNAQVKQIVAQIESQSNKKVSDSKIAEITEIIYEENLAKIGKEMKIPEGRKKKVLEYTEGEKIDENKGVLTSRTFDSFVVNGQFIPGLNIKVNEKTGQKEQTFFKTIGIADERLKVFETKGIEGINNLYNATLSQLEQAYNLLMNLHNNTKDENVKQELLNLANLIVESINDAYNNTQDDDLEELFFNSILGEISSSSKYEELIKNIYTSNGEKSNYRKQGDFFDKIREQLSNETIGRININKNTPTLSEADPFDPHGEDGTSNDNKDNATTIEEEAENKAQAVIDSVFANYITKQIANIKEAFEKNNEININYDDFVKSINKTLEEQGQQAAQELAQLIIEQLIDTMSGNNIKLEVKYDKQSIQTDLTTSPISLTGSVDDEYDPTETIVDEQSNLDENAINNKASLQGIIKTLYAYMGKVLNSVKSEEERSKLIATLEEAKNVVDTLNNEELELFEDFIDNVTDKNLTSNNSIKIIDELSQLIQGIVTEREVENETANKLMSEALPVQEGREKVKKGEAFELDVKKEDDYYFDGYNERIKKAMQSRLEIGELLDGDEILKEALNSVYRIFQNQDTLETDEIATQIKNAFTNGNNVAEFYNIISKILEDANTIETSIKRRTEELNKQANIQKGTENIEYFNYETQLESWLQQNPEGARRYNRSKLVRETFDSNNGMLNPEKALEEIFKINDYYLQKLKKKWLDLNQILEITRTIINEHGEKVQVTEKKNVQDIAISAILGRIDKSGAYHNPNAGMGYFYEENRITGETPPIGVSLSPQELTSLYYKAGYTGAAYGGKNIVENIKKASELLAQKEKKLQEAQEEKKDLIEAEIIVIRKDIETLQKAQERKEHKEGYEVHQIDPFNLNNTPEKQALKNKEKREKKKETELKWQQERMRENLKKGDIRGSFIHKQLGAGVISELLDNGKAKIRLKEKAEDITVILDDFINGIIEYKPIRGRKPKNQIKQPGLIEQKENNISSNMNGENIIDNNGKIIINSHDVEIHDALNTNVNDAVDATIKPIGDIFIESRGNTFLNGEKGNLVSNENSSINTVLNKQSNELSIEGFIPEFREKDEFGNSIHEYIKRNKDGSSEQVYSITTLRDYLLHGNNPTFKEDVKNLRNFAKNWTEDIPFTAQDARVDQEKFNNLKGTIVSGLKGDLFHNLIDTLTKYKGAITSLEELKNSELPEAKEDYDKFQKQYQETLKEIKKYGYDETYLPIKSMLNGYMDLYQKMNKEKGLSMTEFSEYRLGFTMNGKRGKINVGVTPDQLFSQFDNGAFFDTKTGKVKGYESFQLTAQLIALIANLENEITTKAGETKKVKNLIGSVDLAKVFKLYIADVNDNQTELIEYLRLTNEEMYNLIMDAKGIAELGDNPLTKEQQNLRMNRQRATNRIIGSNGEVHEETGFIGNPEKDKAIINNYISLYKRAAMLQAQIVEETEKLRVANEDDRIEIERKIKALKEQKTGVENLMPTADIVYGNIEDKYGLRMADNVIIGNQVISEENVDYFNAKMQEAEGQIRRKEVDTSVKIQNRDKEYELAQIRKYIDAQDELNKLKEQENKIIEKQNKLNRSNPEDERLWLELEREKQNIGRAQAIQGRRIAETKQAGLNVDNRTITYDGNIMSLTTENAQHLSDELVRIEQRRLAEIRRINEEERKIREQNNEKASKKEEQNLKKSKNRYIDLLKQRKNASIELYKLQGENSILQDKITNKTATSLEQEKFNGNKRLIAQYKEELMQTNSEFIKLIDYLRKVGALNEGTFETGNDSDFNARINRVVNESKVTAQKAQNTNNENRIKYEEENQKAFSKTNEANIKALVNNLKERLKIERDIEQQEARRNSVSGKEKDEIEKYLELLRQKKALLENEAPVYDKANETLNGQKLTTQEILSLEQQLSKERKKSDLALAKIRSAYKSQIPLIDQLFGAFKNVLQNVSVYNIAQKGFNALEDNIRGVIEYAKELDSSFVDIRIASGMTSSETREFMQNLNELGKELGMTTQQMATASNDWLRAGYRGQEVVELTKASATLSQLGMIDTADATSYLISSLKGWRLEANEVMNVVDKLTAVDMSAAISAGDLAEAMSRANNSAQLAGISLNRYIGLLTVGADITQRAPESIGQAWNTLIARISNVKAGKFVASQEDMESEDYSEDEFEALNDVEKVLSAVGIKLRENYDTWRDTQDIIDDIGKSWKTWDKTTQNAVSTAVAGTRQREIFATTMQNYDQVAKYETIAENSYGSSQKKMEAYTNSLGAAQKRYQAALEEFSLRLNNTEILTKFYEMITFIISNFEELSAVLLSILALTKGKEIGNLFTNGLIYAGVKATNFGNKLNSVREKGEELGFLGSIKSAFGNIKNTLQESYQGQLKQKYSNIIAKDNGLTDKQKTSLIDTQNAFLFNDGIDLSTAQNALNELTDNISNYMDVEKLQNLQDAVDSLSQELENKRQQIANQEEDDEFDLSEVLDSEAEEITERLNTAREALAQETEAQRRNAVEAIMNDERYSSIKEQLINANQQEIDRKTQALMAEAQANNRTLTLAEAREQATREVLETNLSEDNLQRINQNLGNRRQEPSLGRTLFTGLATSAAGIGGTMGLGNFGQQFFGDSGQIFGSMLGGMLATSFTSTLMTNLTPIGTTIKNVITGQVAGGVIKGIVSGLGGAAATAAIGASVVGLIAIIGMSIVGLVKAQEKKMIEEQAKAFKEESQKYENMVSAQIDAGKFDELSKGVDKLGRNVSLTDEEYQEFLNLNTKLAEKFPSLIKFTNDQGQAFVQASLGANSFSESVEKLIDNQQRLADQALLKPELFNSNYKEAYKQYQEIEEEIEENREKQKKVSLDNYIIDERADENNYARDESGELVINPDNEAYMSKRLVRIKVDTEGLTEQEIQKKILNLQEVLNKKGIRTSSITDGVEIEKVFKEGYSNEEDYIKGQEYLEEIEQAFNEFVENEKLEEGELIKQEQEIIRMLDGERQAIYRELSKGGAYNLGITNFDSSIFKEMSEEESLMMQSLANNITPDVSDPQKYLQEFADRITAYHEYFQSDGRNLLKFYLQLDESDSGAKYASIREKIGKELENLYKQDEELAEKIAKDLGYAFDEENGKIKDTLDVFDNIVDKMKEMRDLSNDWTFANLTKEDFNKNFTREEQNQIARMTTDGMLTNNEDIFSLRRRLRSRNSENIDRISAQNNIARYESLLNDKQWSGAITFKDGVKEYSSELEAMFLKIEEWGEEFSAIDFQKMFPDMDEAMANKFEALGEAIKEGEMTTTEAMNEAGIAVLESVKDSLAKLSEIKIKEIFPDVEIEGFVDTYKEMGDILEHTANGYDKIAQARQIENQYGHIGWKTALELLSANERYAEVLDVVNGKIKLKGNAEAIMADIELATTITALQAANANLEQEANTKLATVALLQKGMDAVESSNQMADATDANIANNFKESQSVAGLGAAYAQLSGVIAKAKMGEVVEWDSSIIESAVKSISVPSSLKAERTVSTIDNTDIQAILERFGNPQYVDSQGNKYNGDNVILDNGKFKYMTTDQNGHNTYINVSVAEWDKKSGTAGKIYGNTEALIKMLEKTRKEGAGRASFYDWYDPENKTYGNGSGSGSGKDFEDELLRNLDTLKNLDSLIDKEYENWIKWTEETVGKRTQAQEEYNKTLVIYNEELNQANKLGVDLSRTKWGNIDTNTRQKLEWTTEAIEANRKALESWGWTKEQINGLEDSSSFTIGMSKSFNDLQIAYTPIINTEHGPEVLSTATFDKYMETLFTNVDRNNFDQSLLALDTQGFEVDGKFIKNIIAGIGKEAELASQAMHFTGATGSIAELNKQLKEVQSNLKKVKKDYSDISIATGKFLESDYYKKKNNSIAQLIKATEEEKAQWESLTKNGKHFDFKGEQITTKEFLETSMNYEKELIELKKEQFNLDDERYQDVLNTLGLQKDLLDTDRENVEVYRDYNNFFAAQDVYDKKRLVNLQEQLKIAKEMRDTASDSQDEWLENNKKVKDLELEIRDLLYEQQQQRFSMLESVDASYDTLISTQYTLLAMSRTQEEYIDNQKNLLDLLQKERDLRQSISEHNQSDAEYMLEYFSGNAFSNSQVYDHYFNISLEELSKQQDIIYESMNAEFNRLYRQYTKEVDKYGNRKYTDDEAYDMAYNSTEVMSKNEEWLKLQQEKGNKIVERIEARLAEVESNYNLLEKSKPDEWGEYGLIGQYGNQQIEKLQTQIDILQEATKDFDKMTDSQINDLVGKLNDATEAMAEAKKNILQEQISYQDKQFDALISYLERMKEDYADLKEEVEDYYDPLLKDLQKEKNDIDEVNQLLELQKNLRASLDKQRVFRQGVGWVKLCP